MPPEEQVAGACGPARGGGSARRGARGSARSRRWRWDRAPSRGTRGCRQERRGAPAAVGRSGPDRLAIGAAGRCPRHQPGGGADQGAFGETRAGPGGPGPHRRGAMGGARARAGEGVLRARICAILREAADGAGPLDGCWDGPARRSMPSTGEPRTASGKRPGVAELWDGRPSFRGSRLRCMAADLPSSRQARADPAGTRAGERLQGVAPNRMGRLEGRARRAGWCRPQVRAGSEVRVGAAGADVVLAAAERL